MKRKNQSGNVLVLTAFGLTVLLGVAGLAVDVGALRHDKRLQQTAADAAAIAAANDLPPYSGYLTAARTAATANGFDYTQTGITVTVNNPPLSGPHAAGGSSTAPPANYVEVIVSAVQPTYFTRIFGITSATVSARAVATNTGGGEDSGCFYTLGAPAKGIGVILKGSATVNATTCGIVDNGIFDMSGGKNLVINAATIGVAGAYNGNGSSTPNCSASSTCPATGMVTAGDPYAYLTAPQPQPAGIYSNGTYNPGLYSSGININSNSNVTFQPGLYVISGGGLTINGGGTVTGTGVTFYFEDNATVNTNGDSTITLTAPSSGTYKNILFYQDPSDTSAPSIGGNDGSAYNGVLYFPRADLTFYGNAKTIKGFTAGIVVANSVDFSGNPTITLTGSASLPGGSVMSNIAVLVE